MTTDPSRVRVSGPLAPYAVGFAQELVRRGYSGHGVTRHVQLLAHLSRWLEAGGFDASDLSEERLAEYLVSRREAGYCQVLRLGWAVTLFGWAPGLVIVKTPEPPADSAVDAVLTHYRRHLSDQLGLAPPTVRAYSDVARSFLAQLERAGDLDLSALSAGEVRGFVIAECRRRKVGSAKVLVTAVRSLLRFLSLEGYTTQPLAGAVPAPSAMGGGYLPRGLAPEVVAGLLASCDRSTATGRRDFAILTVLSRLGLRVGEVSSLALDDVDWHHGEVVVRGKGGRQDRLPLPADVGEAIVAYLADGRPAAEDRAVFLRVHAPIRAMTASNVTEIVVRACRRAGLSVVRGHRLRHSAATAMLAHGASLAEIGQVLRQSRAATTAVYAKVDRTALRTLAQPWPQVSA